MPELYLGLMSGTSVDGIDAVLADFTENAPELIHARTIAWPEELRQQILSIADADRSVTLEEIGALDVHIGEQLASAALEILAESGVPRKQVKAIGSHGQTVCHCPTGTTSFTLQLGDPNRIAELCGITTVADFRRRDMAAGGQGAPLVPAFHRIVFHSESESRAILNIGGMANLTLIPATDDAISGFDTGPGNALMDAWYQRHCGEDFDRDGRWAGSGNTVQDLLGMLLQHNFFMIDPPKSTGRDAFNLGWLDHCIGERFSSHDPRDIQRTLLELTVSSITEAMDKSGFSADRLLVCGGGAHNRFLMQRLGQSLPDVAVESTETLGIHPDWVEGLAFAWLAKRTLAGQTGNLPEVSGASRPVILGGIYPA